MTVTMVQGQGRPPAIIPGFCREREKVLIYIVIIILTIPHSVVNPASIDLDPYQRICWVGSILQ